MHYIFFFPDEMRAKSLGCYGNPVAQTPNIDRLAKQGVLFENAYTTFPVCVASRCSLMTGWFSHVAGFRTLGHYLQPHQPSFLKLIKEAGYQVHLYGKNHCFTKEAFWQSVDVCPEPDFGHDIRKPGRNQLRMDATDYTMLQNATPNSSLENYQDTWCVNQAVEAIRGWKPGDKPLFLFLPLLFPHAPYSMTEHFYGMHNPEDTPVLPWGLPNKPAYHEAIRRNRQLEGFGQETFRKIHSVYLGMCAYSDMLLGRVMSALEETGLEGDSTVILSSDHGDWAGDYGLVEKWPNSMDDDLTRVPLIIRSPGCKAGHRVKAPVQTIDIFPTVCDIEQIEITHDQFGLSLKEQLAGGEGDPGRAVFCEGGYDTREPHCFEGKATLAEGSVYHPKLKQQQLEPETVCRTTMLRKGPWKLVIRTNGENELYHMDNDPGELRNLYGLEQHGKTAHGLERDMLTWLMHTADVVPREGHDTF